MRSRVVLVVAAFTLVLAGPNLPTALYPGYRRALGLDSFGLTVLVSAYLIALVAVLLGSGTVTRLAPRTLVAGGLLASVAADGFLALPPSVAGILAGDNPDETG